jgi:hypothetical protein
VKPPRIPLGNLCQRGPFPRMTIKRFLYFSCVLMVTTRAAIAQAPPGPATPQAQTATPAPVASTNCGPTKPVPPRGTIAPEGSTNSQAAEPLGDKLAKSDGVLCPPAGVDPEIRAPTPNAGNTPVIPPPGSPGGDPTVRPK